MKLKQILNNISNTEILHKLFEFYPEQKESLDGYVDVLEKLRNLTHKESDFKIVIYQVVDFSDEERYWSVSGQKDNDPQYWAIEYTPWEEWLSSEVEFDKRLSLVSVIALCLWEMTWSGFDQEKIKNDIEELNKIALKIIKE